MKVIKKVLVICKSGCPKNQSRGSYLAMFLISLASQSLPNSYFFVGYTRKKFPDMTSDNGVKIALRNKITCLKAKFKKKTV